MPPPMGLRVTTRSLFALTVFSLVLLPAFDTPGALPSVRLDDLLPFLWLPLALRSGLRIPASRAAQLRLGALVVLVGAMTLSITIGSFMAFRTSFLDLIQIVRVVKYILIYLMAYSVFARLPARDDDWLPAFLLRLGVALAVLAVAQYTNVFRLNELYVQYVAPTQFHTLVGNYPNPRPVGMVGNPNVLGFVFALLALVAYAKWHDKFGWLWMAAFAVFASCLALTLSRGAMVALGAGMIAFTTAMLVSGNLRRAARATLIAVLAISSAAAVLASDAVYEQVTWRLVRVLDPSADGSWVARTFKWEENRELFRSSPMFGVGPLRRSTEIQYTADNEWLLLLRSYGAVGAAITALLLWSSLLVKTGHRRALAVAISLACTVFMVPAGVVHSLALFPLIMVLFAWTDLDELRRPSSESQGCASPSERTESYSV